MDDKKTITNAEKKEIINKLNKGEVYFKKLDEKYKCDKDIAIAAINVYYHNIDFISDEFKNNKEFVLELFSRMNDNKRPFYAYDTIFMKLSEMIRNDKEIATLFINQYYECLKYTSEEIRNDKEFLMPLIKKEPGYLKYASDEIKNDKEFLLPLIKEDWLYLEYASDEIRNDKRLLLDLFASYQHMYYSCDLRKIFKNLKEELRYDKEIATLFINQYYECLKYTSEEIRNDKDLILSLFKKYADDKTMKTVEILQYTSDRLLCDKDFIIKLMTESTRFYLGDIFKNILYECILEELKYDDDIIHLKDRGE